MTGKRPGEFELAVLRAIFDLQGRGYALTIADQVGEFLGRQVSLGAIYATTDRLERKGLIKSELGEATPERGGKPKRYYEIKETGRRALADGKAAACRLWGIPLGVAT
jgi:PadR family transcriptional regulator, regulatory protein PadR